jgi:DNA-binding CsgD family transcriptional regulator
LNVWRDRGRHLLRTGQAIPDEEICARAIFKRSEFYNDYLLKVGLTRSLAAIIESDDKQALSLPAMRADHRDAFSREEQNVARHLLPHLAKANLIRQRLTLLRAGEEVLDQLAYGIAFLTGEGSVVYLNRAAESAVRQEDGLLVQRGTLRAHHHGSCSALESAIREICEPSVSMKYPKPVLVQRKSPRRPYQILLAPLRGCFAQFKGMLAPAVVALIIDPEEQRATAPGLLEVLYGLTKKEAIVAAKLAEGKPIERLAEELGMRYETARTHLRRIFDKTGTTRQAALVTLLALLPKQGREPGG